MTYCSKYSYGRRPSSKGSHVSVMSVEPIEVFWWRPTIRLWIYQQTYCQHNLKSNRVVQHQQQELSQQTLISSTIVTVLFIALPIALKTISLEPFSFITYRKWYIILSNKCKYKSVHFPLKKCNSHRNGIKGFWGSYSHVEIYCLPWLHLHEDKMNYFYKKTQPAFIEKTGRNTKGANKNSPANLSIRKRAPIQNKRA